MSEHIVVTLTADGQQIDQSGFVWAFPDSAAEPDRVQVGAPGSRRADEPSLARVVDIVDGPRGRSSSTSTWSAYLSKRSKSSATPICYLSSVMVRRCLPGFVVIAGGLLAASACATSTEVGPACEAAMGAVSGQVVTDMAPLALMQHTLTACESRAEWMMAAERHRRDGPPASGSRSNVSVLIAGSTLSAEEQLRLFCQLRGNIDGPAPACDG